MNNERDDIDESKLDDMIRRKLELMREGFQLADKRNRTQDATTLLVTIIFDALKIDYPKLINPTTDFLLGVLTGKIDQETWIRFMTEIQKRHESASNPTSGG